MCKKKGGFGYADKRETTESTFKTAIYESIFLQIFPPHSNPDKTKTKQQDLETSKVRIPGTDDKPTPLFPTPKVTLYILA